MDFPSSPQVTALSVNIVAFVRMNEEDGEVVGPGAGAGDGIGPGDGEGTGEGAGPGDEAEVAGEEGDAEAGEGTGEGEGTGKGTLVSPVASNHFNIRNVQELSKVLPP